MREELTQLVVHVTLDLDSALAELPAVAAGQLDTPIASGLGTNAGVDAGSRKAPRAIIFGGGLAPENVAAVRDAVAAAAPDVKAVGITEDDIDEAQGAGPEIDAVAAVLKAKLTAATSA